MSASRRRLTLTAVAAAAVGLGEAPLILASGHQSERGAFLGMGLFVGWSFVGAGLFAWWRRPGSRLGLLLVATGFAWFVRPLGASDNDWLFAAAFALGSLPFAMLAHFVFAFPSGRLRTVAERALVTSGYFVATAVPVGQLLFFDTHGHDGCARCPSNPLRVAHDQSAYSLFSAVHHLGGAVVVVGAIAVVARRWHRATTVQRRGLAPVLWAGAITLAVMGALLAAAQAGVVTATPGTTYFGALLGFASVPYAFLLGVLRIELSGAAAVSRLISLLGEGARRAPSLREALAGALGDPSLALAYWLPERRIYADVTGREVALPPAGSGRAATPIEREGQPVAVILHDESLAEHGELVRAAGAAAALSLENERLAAELRARIEELRASRTRIVEAGDEERRRLERDLHDGAQQRLVAVALTLQLMRASGGGDPHSRALVDEAIAELTEATSELRELARGIHPAILTERGLGAALTALAGRAPVPVELLGLPEGRFDGAVEATAYFVVAEALTNVARYSQASHVEVELAQHNGTLVVEVRDDGVGGADPERGSGLRGLGDRVAAVDGRLVVTSEAGAGTTIRAEIPCAR